MRPLRKAKTLAGCAVALALLARTPQALNLPGLLRAPARPPAFSSGRAQAVWKAIERPRNQIAAPVAAPKLPSEDGPPKDRILIMRSRRFTNVTLGVRATPEFAPAVGHKRQLFCDRFEQPWVEGREARLRVTYLRPVGVAWGQPDGYGVHVAGGGTAKLPGAPPASHQRAYPVYLAGDSVEFEVEIESARLAGLPPLRLYARQERLTADGGAGRALGPLLVLDAPAVTWGGRAVVRGRFRLSGSRAEPVNLEQTHLTLASLGPRSEEILLDANQAGVVDPPARLP